MELEEMKQDWERMSERLQHSERINRRLIRDIVVGKGKYAQDRVLNRMSNWTIVLVACEVILLGAFVLYVVRCLYDMPEWKLDFALPLCMIAMCSGAYGIWFNTVYGNELRRIDFSGCVASQLEIVGRLMTSWAKFMLIDWIIFILCVALLLLEGFLDHNPGQIFWTLLLIPACMLLSRLDNNRFRRDTQSIRESLEKLRETENEECRR